jgi:hypothetical protein
MTPSRLEELRKVAEQANANSSDLPIGPEWAAIMEAREVHRRTFTREVVLELLDTIKTLREALERINREAYASPSYAESIKKIRVIARDAIGE